MEDTESRHKNVYGSPGFPFSYLVSAPLGCVGSFPWTWVISGTRCCSGLVQTRSRMWSQPCAVATGHLFSPWSSLPSSTSKPWCPQTRGGPGTHWACRAGSRGASASKDRPGEGQVEGPCTLFPQKRGDTRSHAQLELPPFLEPAQRGPAIPGASDPWRTATLGTASRSLLPSLQGCEASSPRCT